MYFQREINSKSCIECGRNLCAREQEGGKKGKEPKIIQGLDNQTMQMPFTTNKTDKHKDNNNKTEASKTNTQMNKGVQTKAVMGRNKKSSDLDTYFQCFLAVCCTYVSLVVNSRLCELNNKGFFYGLLGEHRLQTDRLSPASSSLSIILSTSPFSRFL